MGGGQGGSVARDKEGIFGERLGGCRKAVPVTGWTLKAARGGREGGREREDMAQECKAWVG